VGLSPRRARADPHPSQSPPRRAPPAPLDDRSLRAVRDARVTRGHCPSPASPDSSPLWRP
jgi:hypothetical protein